MGRKYLYEPNPQAPADSSSSFPLHHSPSLHQTRIDSHTEWLRSSLRPFHLDQVFVSPGKIQSLSFTPNPTQTPPAHPSQSASAGSVNSSSATAFFGSSENIPAFDFTSFITASQQSTWLPSPASHAQGLQTASSNSQRLAPQQQQFPQGDFVLYDQPAQISPSPRRLSAPLQPHTFNPAPRTLAYSPAANTIPSTRIRSNTTRPPVPLFNSNSTGNLTHYHNNHNQAHLKSLRVNTMSDHNLFGDMSNVNVAGDFGSAGLFDFDMSAASNFTAINETPASTSTQTVSPKDLFNDSAPASTAFTNLTSPDLNASPFGADSYQTSPAFMTEGDFSAGGDSNHWFSLFPENVTESLPAAGLAAPTVQRTESTNSFNSSASSSASPAVHARKVSLTDTPPSARHSSVSGVKPRRRKGPLPSIELDPNDKVAFKRARNTLAARDSRQRKLEHLALLENRIDELESENARLREFAAQHGYSPS